MDSGKAKTPIAEFLDYVVKMAAFANHEDKSPTDVEPCPARLRTPVANSFFTADWMCEQFRPRTPASLRARNDAMFRHLPQC